MRKVFRFLRAFVRWAMSGFKRSKFAKQRLAICEACPMMEEDRTCGVCGCYLDVKTKWLTESCPEDKW